MAAVDILNTICPVSLDTGLASLMISNAAIYVSLYDTIPAARLDLATALYACHLLSQAGYIQPVVSESTEGGVLVSFQQYNLGDKDGVSTWLQEFTKLVPDFFSPQVIL